MSQVTDISGMFSSASLLKNLDVLNWNTSRVQSMNSMFYNARSLKSLDLSNWDTSNVYSMNHFLSGMDNLDSVVLGKRINLKISAYLPEKIKPPYTGEWIHQESDTMFSSSKDFLNYSSEPGTYRCVKRESWNIQTLLKGDKVPTLEKEIASKNTTTDETIQK